MSPFPAFLRYIQLALQSLLLNVLRYESTSIREQKQTPLGRGYADPQTTSTWKIDVIGRLHPPGSRWTLGACRWGCSAPRRPLPCGDTSRLSRGPVDSAPPALHAEAKLQRAWSSQWQSVPAAALSCRTSDSPSPPAPFFSFPSSPCLAAEVPQRHCFLELPELW